jgi:SAM-dependent methyltransferase
MRIDPAPGPATLLARPPVPTVLHLGSGKSFRPDWLNLDANPAWKPDIVADLNQPLPRTGEVFRTERFGPVELRAGSFQAIVACDVLEHIRDLETCMTSCLDLLVPGGVFVIEVPYDLSYGAWQDPTHVRAFNERSWLYYTDWCWYLGWDRFHFGLQKLDMALSDVGRAMRERGVATSEILRQPRAVDAMHVELVKQALTPEMIETCRRYRNGRA